MSPRARLGAFVAVVAAIFGAAMTAGGALPEQGLAARQPAPAHGEDEEMPMDGHDAEPRGLSSYADGYRLAVEDATLPRGEARLAFRILGEDGRPLRRYIEENEKLMHLIVVRRDLSGYQHLHPEMTEDATWVTPLTLDRAGVYRVIADFAAPDGDEERLVTLGADVHVDGAVRAERLPEPRQTTRAGAYEVAMTGEPVAGEERELTFTVLRDGAPVTDLGTYLGAAGHLVALREGDVAYRHMHDVGTAGGPHIRFESVFPGPGRYRLFLQFDHDGAVHTAAWTVDIEEEA